ncbi:hypothetical protein FIBSPDRAFT_899031 [Athelia psychrophila]|uniref:Uncharacterized protein n=1 Tax=Athelia psychrophila TaxID=1759441 RepID=A0A166A756_9AGAM|nr:hypothetical protein FIBSPDRAFT_899031 [Fibularhizoctonia sp. CBS 109695]
MRHAILTLQCHPYSFSEMVIGVAYAQRLYLDALALTDYLERGFEARMCNSGVYVQPRLSHVHGASSTDIEIVHRLQLAGLPAYFVVPRQDALVLGATHIDPSPPSPSFASYEWTECPTAVTMPILYTGDASAAMHNAMSLPPRHASLERLFFGFDDDFKVVPIGTRGTVVVTGLPTSLSNRRRKYKISHSQEGGAPSGLSQVQRDKWAEITGDYVPLTVPGWSAALKRVDRHTRLAVPAPKRFTGYRIPDPGMIIYSETRRERNIFAWLVSRSANLRRLSNALGTEDGVPDGFSNELWRVYLCTDVGQDDLMAGQRLDRTIAGSFNGRAPAAQRRRAAVSIFGRPPDKFNLQEATWNEHLIRWGTAFHHDPRLVQEIMWDLHWSSFRFDLIALDRFLAPDRWISHKYERLDALSTITGCSDALVYEDGRIENLGIASDITFERNRAYAAFAALMDSWPPSPDGSAAIGTDCAETIAFRYCSSFANVFGRPLVLPKLVPVVRGGHGIIPYPSS